MNNYALPLVSSLDLFVDPLELNVSPELVPLELVKTHCAIDGSDLDTLLQDVYIPAAVSWAEGFAHRTIFTREHVWTIRDFPRCGSGHIRLPRGKTQSVEAIRYYDSDGNLQSLFGASATISPTGDDFGEMLGGDDGATLAAGDNGWPTVSTDRVAPVQIEFFAGWTSAQLPKDVLHAILFAISDMVDTRGSADLTSFGKNLTTRMALMSPYQIVTFNV